MSKSKKQSIVAGDIVRKVSGADLNQTGIVLKYEVNSLHNEIVTVMTPRGVIKNWYGKLVRRLW